MDVEHFKGLSRNRQVFIIDRDYRNYLQKIIQRVMYSYFGLPETVEDIYWLFMFEVIQMIKEFHGKCEKEFLSFLGLKCKFFTHEHCRELIKPSYRVLNNSLNLNEATAHSELVEESEEELVLNDSETPIEMIDISVLDEKELLIYKMFFIEAAQIKDIVDVCKMTRYKIKTTIETIRKKLQKSIKK